VPVTTLALAACRPAATTLAFRPRPGAVFRYAIHVTSRSTTHLAGRAPTARTDQATFVAVDTVTDATAEGSRVQVLLQQTGTPTRTYEIRLNRRAELVGIDSVDGRPADAATGLEVEDLLPAAVGAPPDRPLRAGDSWAVDQAVQLPHIAPTRLRGAGRLEQFGVVGRRTVAMTTATATVALAPASESPGLSPPVPPGFLGIGGPLPAAPATDVGLRGWESTESAVTRAVDDGAIERSTSKTTGVFDILLTTTGDRVGLVGGQLDVEVTSMTKRLD
jgi:hypothetical protein